MYDLPSLMILWLARPLIWLGQGSAREERQMPEGTHAAKPTPQASFSSEGS